MNEQDLQKQAVEQQIKHANEQIRMRCLELAIGRNNMLPAEKSQHSPDEVLKEARQYINFVTMVGENTKQAKK